MVPVRAEPGLAPAVNVTVPGPLPAVPEFTVIHDALLAPVHPHPAGRLTAMAPPGPPLLPNDWDAGLIELAQPPAWFTVNTWPPILTDPVRAGPTFACAAMKSGPDPDPDAPDVRASHGSRLTGFHGHPSGAMTPTLSVPPLVAMDWLAGENDSVHDPA